MDAPGVPVRGQALSELDVHPLVRLAPPERAHRHYGLLLPERSLHLPREHRALPLAVPFARLETVRYAAPPSLRWVAA